MFWACFGYGIKSDLVVLNKDLLSPNEGVLSRTILSCYREHLGTVLELDSIFMQDNTEIHTAKIVKKWLQEEGIEIMEWPAYSPDLNPIENL